MTIFGRAVSWVLQIPLLPLNSSTLLFPLQIPLKIPLQIPLHNGVKQGGCFSPLLFAAYFDGLKRYGVFYYLLNDITARRFEVLYDRRLYSVFVDVNGFALPQYTINYLKPFIKNICIICL